METRANPSPIKASEPGRIRGYAAAYDQPTTIRDALGREFREVIRPGAFTRSLKEQPDVRLLRDHEPSLLLGRTKSGTLTVGEDAYGLWFECSLPDTAEGRSVQEAIRRGDLDACSFGFTVKADEWVQGDIPTRELRDVTLYECSVVAFPAYQQGTSVDLRSVQLTPDDLTRRKQATDMIKLKLKLLEMKSGA